MSQKMYASKVLRRLEHRPPSALGRPVRVLRQWSRTTSLPAVRTVKRRMWRPEPRPVASAEDAAAVAELLRPDVELLSELVDPDLGHWLRG